MASKDGMKALIGLCKKIVKHYTNSLGYTPSAEMTRKYQKEIGHTAALLTFILESAENDKPCRIYGDWGAGREQEMERQYLQEQAQRREEIEKRFRAALAGAAEDAPH
jgi:hypothetical protein